MMEKLKSLSGKQIALLIFLAFGAIFAMTNQKKQQDDLMVDNYENKQEVVGEATGENTGDVENNEFEPSGEDVVAPENTENNENHEDVVTPEPTEEPTEEPAESETVDDTTETETDTDTETDTETDVESGTESETETETDVKAEIPSEIILVSGEVGDYGEHITMNGHSYLIYRIPAGTYTAINAGEETAQFIIISNDTKDVNGTTYPTSTSTVLLYRDDHAEITVSDNQYIELQGESSFKFVRME